MIISENSQPELNEFQKLMSNTDQMLNDDAAKRQDYYTKRSGKPLEQDVFDALNECAKGTAFQGTMLLVSGASFPDIIAKKYYGVEVKSTEKNHWTSIGSSILESTRDRDVKRIFLTFGKLGKPVRFLSRPYEDCLSGIAVTHYPRYQIDMRLGKGETIFDKMGIPYDELRMMDNPVTPVSQYYKRQLMPGESLWWATDDVDMSAPPTVRLWNTLSSEQREELTVQGYALFPEVLTKGNSKKYNRYALWLVTQRSIVNTNVRDGFSAGGKVLMKTSDGIDVIMPAAFGRIQKYHELIENVIEETEPEILEEYWEEPLENNRIRQWCNLVARAANSDPDIGYKTAWGVLTGIFSVNREERSQRQAIRIPNKVYPIAAHLSKVAETTIVYGEEIELDDNDELSLTVDICVGDKVKHKSLGIGTVKGFKKNLIAVEFPNGDEVFTFPDCFLRDGFLKKL